MSTLHRYLPDHPRASQPHWIDCLSEPWKKPVAFPQESWLGLILPTEKQTEKSSKNPVDVSIVCVSKFSQRHGASDPPQWITGTIWIYRHGNSIKIMGKWAQRLGMSNTVCRSLGNAKKLRRPSSHHKMLPRSVHQDTCIVLGVANV